MSKYKTMHEGGSLRELIHRAGLSVSGLSSALGYNNVTLNKRLDEYDKNPDECSEPYLKSIFYFLFKYRVDSDLGNVGFHVRYAIVTEYLAKRPHDRIEEVLEGNKYIDFLLINARELDLELKEADESLSKEDNLTTYAEIVQRCLASFDVILPLKTKYQNAQGNHAKYVVFTTKGLHETIRPGPHPRTLWQNIRDPFYFTFCVDPKYKNLGLTCELWLYESSAKDYEKNLDNWKEALEGVGLKWDTQTKNYIRCYHKTFDMEKKKLEDNFLKELQSGIPEVERKVLAAYKSLTK